MDADMPACSALPPAAGPSLSLAGEAATGIGEGAAQPAALDGLQETAADKALAEALNRGDEQLHSGSPSREEPSWNDRGGDDSKVPLLQVLCERVLEHHARHVADVEVVLRTARAANNAQLEQSCLRIIEKSLFPVLRETRSKVELDELIGAERVAILEAAHLALERAKQENASLRTGSVLDVVAVDSRADEHGNYPLDALKAGVKWPPDVDPAHREKRLATSEFFNLFGMDKAAFAALAPFKQVRMKKEMGLF